eukprot:7985635-Ditylum_brightwellii.AAC.1
MLRPDQVRVTWPMPFWQVLTARNMTSCWRTYLSPMRKIKTNAQRYQLGCTRIWSHRQTRVAPPSKIDQTVVLPSPQRVMRKKKKARTVMK